MLYGATPQVLAFLRERFGVPDYGPSVAFGLVDGSGALRGGVVFSKWVPGVDIELSAFVETKAWFRPRSFARVFTYPFVDLGLPRLTMHIGRKNKAARAFADKAGFRLEGVRRRGQDGRQDRMLYGMLREECRFLKGHAHG